MGATRERSSFFWWMKNLERYSSRILTLVLSPGVWKRDEAKIGESSDNRTHRLTLINKSNPNGTHTLPKTSWNPIKWRNDVINIQHTGEMQPGHFNECENKCVTTAYGCVICRCCFLNWLESMLKGMEETELAINEGKYFSKCKTSK